MREIPVLEVRGDSFHCGEAVGQALKDQIHVNFETYMDVFRHAAGVDAAKVRAYAEGLLPVMEKHAPDLLEEMRGLAAGSGLDVLSILALNARTEILYGLQQRSAADKVDVGDECTSIGVLPEVTRSGHTLIGQNWDWKAAVIDRTAVLRIEKPGAPKQIVFTEAGFVGKIGMNEHGIGVCANLLISAHDKGQLGVPYHVMLRMVLGARSLHEAITAVTLPPRGASGNFLIGARGGEVIDLEASPLGFDYLLPQDGVLTHSNHFLSPEMRAADMRRGSSALSMIRYARARRLIMPDAPAIEPQSLMRVFRDHVGFPYSICRHVNEEEPIYDRVLSGASIVMDLDGGDFYIAPGPPCEGEFKRHGVA